MAERKNDIMWRVYLVFGGFVLFGLAVVFKIGQLQIVEGDYWKRKADSLTLSYKSIEPLRGNIYTADGSMLATSLPRYDVHVDMNAPSLTRELFNKGIDSLSLCLSNLFRDKSAADYKKILKKARKSNERFFLLKRNISYEEKKALTTFPLFKSGKTKGGLIISQLSRRERPFRELAARTIGFKVENKAVTPVGIEGSFDKDLRGVKGQRLMQKIAGNVWKPVNDDNEIEPKDGYDIVTTIDLNLQDVAESALENRLMEENAKMGCAVLMEVATGEIKAIANLKRSGDDAHPVYSEEYNYAIGQATEPGSTFKLISLMAAMEDGYTDPDQITETYGGIYPLKNGFIIHDSHTGLYDKLTVKKAFAVSSNAGVASLISKYYSRNPQSFIDRINRMHVGDCSDIQLSGAANTRFKNATDKNWWGTSLAQISIGYEALMTPLQILTFYNAVANNGRMVKPHFVKEVRNKGQLVKNFPVEIIADSICSKQTIANAKSMLEEVVLSGTASQIKNNEYAIAGKTGTAQIADRSTGYKNGDVKYQASFCGYFPADKPKYSCIIVIYEPGNGAYYGAAVACPVFKAIADRVYALNVEMHEELKQTQPVVAGPAIKGGKTDATAFVLKKIGVNTQLPDEEWLSTNGKAYVPLAGCVPDVIGMGLRDAVLLLESKGLNVKPYGRGTVIRQSLSPGSKLPKGQQIIIELG